MVTIVKSEWHQVERRFSIDFDFEMLSEIYPDFEEEEINDILQKLELGEVDLDLLIEDAEAEGIDLFWDWMDEDDYWTERKGGYDVTYESVKE